MKISNNKIVALVIYTTLLFFIFNTTLRVSATENKGVNIIFTSEDESVTFGSTIVSTRNEVLTCYNKPNTVRHEPRGEFYVLYNYVVAEKTFRCNESVTYTTHGDVSFLDNLEPLLERWRGPISLALYAPGTDFYLTLKAVRYARACLSPLVKQYVTFHLYFDEEHTPGAIPLPFLDGTVNCTAPAPWENVKGADLYKIKNNLRYPVNVGRNVARETSLTYFVLASDIELYPSPGVIKDFLDMVNRGEPYLLTAKPKVFPLAIFEVEANMTVPNNKTELVKMLRNGSAITFHESFCLYCHNIPKAMEWRAAKESSGLHVFTTEKRIGEFWSWEPTFIGTHSDPLYDERLSWDGMKDKMTQAFAMCNLDYEFLVLDNAYLVHKPGIKEMNILSSNRIKIVIRTNALIAKTIKPELIKKYGERNGCTL